MQTSAKNYGVSYIVFNNPQIMLECEHSAASLKKFNPGISIQLITNIPAGDFRTKHFDFIDKVDEKINPWKGKTKYLTSSRFDRTLFLDADTEIRGNITQLFDELNDFDLILTFDNLCDWSTKPPKFVSQISSDINTGFVLYKKEQQVWFFLKEWFEKIYDQDESVMTPGHYCDQHYFNTYLRDRALAGNDIKTKIISNEIYNVRPWCWAKLKSERKFDKALIIHAHHLHHTMLDKLRRKINSIMRVQQA